jgi:hypothetical protein
MNNLGPEKQIKMQQRGNTERSLADWLLRFRFLFRFSIDLFSDLSSLYSSVFERVVPCQHYTQYKCQIWLPCLACFRCHALRWHRQKKIFTSSRPTARMLQNIFTSSNACSKKSSRLPTARMLRKYLQSLVKNRWRE